MGKLVAAMCWPVDRTGLPEEIDGIPLPQPRVDDTLTNCLACGREVWIGPKQLEQVNLGVAGPCCCFCTAGLRTLNPGMNIETLNPDRVDQPRTGPPPPTAAELERAMRLRARKDKRR